MKNKFLVQLLETTASLITAAFGLVAALAWNSAITKYINDAFKGTDFGELGGLIVYAVIVTVIAVIATMLIAWALGKAKSLGDKEESEEKSEE